MKILQTTYNSEKGIKIANLNNSISGKYGFRRNHKCVIFVVLYYVVYVGLVCILLFYMRIFIRYYRRPKT
jgi:hypothetical protein